MNVGITITVRMKSKRLPRKAMLEIEGIPMIVHLIERLKQTKKANKIVVCTSTNKEDDVLEEVARRTGVDFFRGSEDDVLYRLLCAAKKYDFDFIVSTTGDNPLTDPIYIDKIIDKFHKTKADFITCFGLPLGTFSYGIKVSALQKVCEIKKNTDTELWTNYFLKYDIFRKETVEIEEELKHPELRLTVDTPEDFEVMKKIFAALYKPGKVFKLKDVVKYLLSHKNIIKINAHIKQRVAKDVEIRKTYKIIKVGNKKIGHNMPVFVIAEAGINHNGKLDIAKKMVDAAKMAGADAIKFQFIKADTLTTKNTEMAPYQKRNLGTTETQFEMLKKYELQIEDFKEIKKYCDKKGIIFLLTVHSTEMLDEVDKIVDAHKIPSGDITNLYFLKEVARKNKPIFLSTGMSTIDEVKEAVDVIKSEGNDKIILLHCTTNYPCPPKDVNMRSMLTLGKETGCFFGYSDHTKGILAPILAVSLGAVVIEKHFTLDKNAEGPDHKASLDPDELKRMIDCIRTTSTMLGSPLKIPTKSEYKIMPYVRKSIVAFTDIPKGTVITKHMLIIKRPGTGIQPKYINDIVGKTAIKDIKKDEIITWEKIL